MNGDAGNTVECLSPASFCVPDHLPPSAWIEHGPLAFWLAEALKPRLYIEIGLGRGFAYFSFCQAIDRFGLSTRAIGVGASEDVREEDALAGVNDRYARFSTLVHPPDGAATALVAPGSVDLLHIDEVGAAEAEAALARWRPLLASDAVLLLHGVGAQAGGNGASRLYDELAGRHPAIRFPQGAGLGLVAPGTVVPDPLRPLLVDLGPDQARRTLDAYAALGRALRTHRDLIANRDGLKRLLTLPEAERDGADPIATSEIVARRPAGTGPRSPAALGTTSSGADPEVSRSSERPPAYAGAPPHTASRQGNESGDPVEGDSVTPADLDRLRAKLRDVLSSEAAAQRLARLVGRALRARHGELGRQALETEEAAASARAEVVRLAAEAWKLMERELAADHVLTEAQVRMDELLRHEQHLLRPRRDLKHILTFGVARRMGRQARTYARLVGKMDQAAADIRDAREAYALAKEERRRGQELAIAAEPRASELASAAVVLRGEYASAEEILSTLPPDTSEQGLAADDYTRWVDLYDTISDADRRGIRARLLRLDYKPTISVIMPVYNPPIEFLRQAVASVRSQLYTEWELCIADDASPDPAVCDLLRGFAAADPRIKFIERASNGHISAASNSALTLATGEFLALMDHDDVLPERALFEIVAYLNERRELDLIYSDEDHIDQHGNRSNPYFKSDYNHDLMLGHNVVNHLGVYRRALVEKLGGFRLGFEGSQDYDLALRVIDASSPSRIGHVPAILYHWRSNAGGSTFSEAFMQRCIDSARRALADHLFRRGERGRVEAHPIVPVWQRIVRARPDPVPLVSVVIPTKDKAEILGPCVDGLLRRTDYPKLEIIIVDHQSTDSAAIELLARLAEDPRVAVVPYEGPFNYSAINNAAVARTRGTILALLNNDVEVIHSDWLDEMVALAALPSVGAVGAKLLYPDNRVQHGGVLLGPGGVAGHYFHLLDAHDPGYFGRAVMTSTVAAVTAACLVLRKSVFEEVGGFDEQNLAVAFNDVDLCLKIGERGYRNVLTPQARLYHHESLSRGSDQTGERLRRFNREIEFMMQKWDSVLGTDPFYNPNLNLATGDFSLSFPPRRRKPWRAGLEG